MIAIYNQQHTRCWIGGRKIRCRRKARYMVCSRDGKPYTSRLEGRVCKVHLEVIVEKLCDEGHAWEEKG